MGVNQWDPYGTHGPVSHSDEPVGSAQWHARGAAVLLLYVVIAVAIVLVGALVYCIPLMGPNDA